MSVVLYVDLYPEVVSAVGKSLLACYGNSLCSHIGSAILACLVGSGLFTAVEHCNLAYSLVVVLEVEVDALDGLESECALGLNCEVDEVGTSCTCRDDVAACLVNGNAFNLHVMVDKGANRCLKTVACIVAACGVGVEYDGHGTVGSSRAKFLARSYLLL